MVVEKQKNIFSNFLTLLNRTSELFCILPYLFENSTHSFGSYEKASGFCERKFPLCGLVERKSSGFVWFKSKQWWYKNQLLFFKSETLLSFLGNDHNMNICRFWVWTKKNYTELHSLKLTCNLKMAGKADCCFFLKPAYSGSCSTCSFSGGYPSTGCQSASRKSDSKDFIRPSSRSVVPDTCNGGQRWVARCQYGKSWVSKMVFQDLKTDASYHDLIETLSVHDLKICSFTMF